ncbi:MAG: FecR domain-containing protein [Cyclobacteriaceae bacterium]
MSDPILEKYNLRRYKDESSNDPMIDWMFENSVAEAPETDVDLAWNKLQSKVSEPVQKSWYSSPLFRVAASVAIIAIAVFGTQQYWNADPLTEIAATSQGHEVVFPDGSRSVLNEQAVVAYPEKFDDTRTIEFEGEAYFDIVKDTKPFIIKMNGIDVRVLGTAFNLTTSGDNVEVLVERGLVAFEKGDKQV